MIIFTLYSLTEKNLYFLKYILANLTKNTQIKYEYIQRLNKRNAESKLVIGWFNYITSQISPQCT